MILVIVGIRTEKHSLRSQVGIGSESDCMFGQPDRILDISDSVAGLKVEKSGGVAVGEGECGDCLLYTSPSPRDRQKSRMPSSA